MGDANIPVSVPPPVFHRASIGRYEIVYPLATGGMASVYVGRLIGFAGFEKLVTIKMIHPHLGTQNVFVKMFMDEARLAARIHHPNVSEVYEIGRDEGQLFMACEFVNGRSLKHLIEAAIGLGQNVSKTFAAWVSAQVCEGLHAAHELTGDDGEQMSMVHRDVSPGNILISYDGYVKLIDFGIAFANDRNFHTTTGIVKGKYGFIAPELLKQESFDRRADVFSTGVMLYLLATGHHPFDAVNDIDILRKTVEADFVSPSKVLTSIDPELEYIIVKAMQLDPEKRYQTSADMGQSLLSYARKIRKRVGTADVKEVMDHFFADKKDIHRQKLKEFRENASGSTRIGSLSEPGANRFLEPAVSEYENFGEIGIESTEKVEVSPPDRSSREDEQAYDVTVLPADGSDPSVTLESWDMETDSSIPHLEFTEKGTGEAAGSVRFRSRIFTISAAVGGLTIVVFAMAVVFSNGKRAEPPDWKSIEIVESGDMPSTVTASGTGQAQSVSNTEHLAPPPDKQARIPVALSIHPSSAELSVDGTLVEIKDNVLLLADDRKEHVITATAPGYVSEIYRVVAEPSLSLSIELVSAKKTEEFMGKSAHRKNLRSARTSSNEVGVLLRNPY